MASKQNIIYVYFKGKHLTISKSQYQYNHGQFLYFADLDLPQTFEVHFSNRDRGESKVQVGSNKLVEIPDEYFWSGALQIYAWIYLHSGADDGETVYEVKIPLIKRAKPTDEELLPQQQGVIDRAIAELNNAVNVTTENANKTNADKIIVNNIKDEVVVLKDEIDSTATTINQKAQETINASERAETSAQNAATSENKALNYSQQAEQSAQSALESKNVAQQKAEVATNASSEALGYRNEALEAKDQAIQAKQNIVDYRDETKGYRDETLNLKNNVQTLKNQIDETAEEIKDISDTVKEDAQSASQSASSASQSSTNASQFASQAKKSADDAEELANQVEQNKNQTETFKNQSEEYKTQAETFKSQAGTFKNQAEEFKNQTETNVTHYPKIIGEYWYIWDATNGEYINTNVDANGIKGDTGNGIASVALNDDYTLTITFTDDTTYTTPSIRGQQGEKGDTGRTGESGVYIGTEEPENEDVKVWIDIDDDGTSEDLVADITDLQETNKKILNTYPTKTVSGAIATFDDSVEGLPLKELTIDINPVQDLHGYESPWIGGAGKNLLNLNRSTIVDSGSHPRLEPKEFNEDQIWVGLSFNDYFIPSRVSKYNIAEDTVSLTITSSAYGIGFPIKCEAGTSYAISQLVVSDENICFGIGFYDETGTYISSQSQAVSKVFTTPSTCEWLVVVFAPKNAQVETTYTKPQLEKGSTITDYAPYENICPISGWTECEVNATGKNLLTYVPNKISVPLSVTLDKSRATLVKKGITYTMSFDMQNVTTWRICAVLFDIEGNRHFVNGEYPFGIVIPYLGSNASGQYYVWGGNYTFKSFVITPINDFYVMFFFLLGDTSASTVMVNPMLEIGSNPTPYEPYNGATIPINWQTEAGTVYGGKLDVLTGKLTVYPYYASYNGETLTGRWISDRDVYAVGTTPTIGAQVVNIGAQGTEYQLEPHEVSSLLGTNNIFADTGNSTVEYIYDPMKYIDDQINVDDVQINDVSIVQDGVAKIPFATSDTAGVVKVDPYTNAHYGGIASIDNKLFVVGSPFSGIKYGGDYSKPVVAGNQHVATFYGLAKVSGTDEKDSTLPVGQYTEEAKASIKTMLGVEDVTKEDVYDVYATDTATGTISSFEDGADDVPLKSLVVDINPVQDLHGYDSPWVAGGGKNLFDADTVYADYKQSDGSYIGAGNIISRIRFNIPESLIGKELTFSGYMLIPSDSTMTNCRVAVKVNGSQQSGNYVTRNTYTRSSVTFTPTTADDYVLLTFGSNGSQNFQFKELQLEVGSTATDWTPYENICPISGWTGVNVWADGRNLFDPTLMKDQVGWNIIKIYAPVGTTLTMSTNNTDVTVSTGLLTYLKRNGESQGAGNSVFASHPVTRIVYDDGYVEVVQRNPSRTKSFADFQWQIEIGSTATAYEPYQGQSIPINWQTEAGTVYGGKLDVLSGVMRINLRSVVVDNTKIVRDSGTRYHVAKSNIGDFKSTAFARMNKFRPRVAPEGWNTGGTFFLDSNNLQMNAYRAFDTRAEFIEEYGELQLGYTLATPIEIQLTPHEVNSLLGTNNIFADTGDTTAEYRADTKLYINKKITEAISALT